MIDHEEILKLRQEGLTYAQIGQRFGVSRQRIHQIITEERARQAGIPSRGERLRKRNQGILERAQQGHTVQEIAQEFGLAVGYTYKLLSTLKRGNHD